jgi:hypothetical protein
MNRRYRNYGLASAGAYLLSMAGMTQVTSFFDPVAWCLIPVVFVAGPCAILFLTRAKGYPWALGLLLAIFAGPLAFIGLVVTLILPDRLRTPEQDR